MWSHWRPSPSLLLASLPSRIAAFPSLRPLRRMGHSVRWSKLLTRCVLLWPHMGRMVALSLLLCLPASAAAVVAAAAGETLYDLLGIERSATEQEIKKAYKRMALKNHPDKAPEAEREKYEERFKKISRAYEILSDPQKRQIYDQRGEAAFQGQDASGPGSGHGGASGFAGGDPFQQFRDMFGQNFGFGQRKTPDVGYAMEVTLEEIYQGVTRDVMYEQDVVCKSCSGRGATRIDRCKTCGGAGATVEVRQWGNGYAQVQSTCRSCGGQGATVPPGAHCTPCRGAGIMQQQARLPVTVRPGCPDGERFVFRGKADEQPDMQTGDVVVEVRQKRHARFTRIGTADLLMEHKVSLLDALCGVRFSVTHLDGSSICVSCGEGKVVRPGEIWSLSGRGMPRQGRSDHGDLLVRFEVQFPSDLPSGASREQLRPLLDPKAPAEPAAGTGGRSWFPFGAGKGEDGKAIVANRLSKNRSAEVSKVLEEREREARRGGGRERQQRGGGGGECAQQ